MHYHLARLFGNSCIIFYHLILDQNGGQYGPLDICITTHADPFQNTVLTEGDAVQNVVFGHFVIIFPVLRSGAFMSGVKSLLN